MTAAMVPVADGDGIEAGALSLPEAHAPASPVDESSVADLSPTTVGVGEVGANARASASPDYADEMPT